MVAILLNPDCSRAEYPPKNGTGPYTYLEFQMRICGIGRMGLQDLYGFRMFFHEEGEELFLPYNPYATAMLTAHLKDVRAIFGTVAIVPKEEMQSLS
jgi:hypothetical protein